MDYEDLEGQGHVVTATTLRNELWEKGDTCDASKKSDYVDYIHSSMRAAIRVLEQMPKDYPHHKTIEKLEAIAQENYLVRLQKKMKEVGEFLNETYPPGNPHRPSSWIWASVMNLFAALSSTPNRCSEHKCDVRTTWIGHRD